MRTGTILALVIAVALIATTVAGQTDIDTDLFAGRISPPTPPPAAVPMMAPENATAMIAETRLAVAPQPRAQILLIPVYLDTSTSSISQITTGVVFPAKRFRGTLSYSYVSPDGSKHLDSYGGAVRWKPWATENAGLSLVGGYSDTRTASKKTQAGLVGEFHIIGPLTLGADVRWARKETATSSPSDIVPLATGGLNFGKVILGLGYTFKNDVDGRDDSSAEIQVPLQIGVISGAVMKHGSWRVGFTRAFDIK